MKVHPSLFKNEKYRELMTSNLNPKMPENTRDSEDRPVSFMQEQLEMGNENESEHRRERGRRQRNQDVGQDSLHDPSELGDEMSQHQGDNDLDPITARKMME